MGQDTAFGLAFFFFFQILKKIINLFSIKKKYVHMGKKKI